MQRRTSWTTTLAPALIGCAGIALAGCASPGPPRPPSLHLPALVRNLAAARTADTVTLTFTAPQRTTDNVAIREKQLGLKVCRQLEHAVCQPVPPLDQPVSTAGVGGKPAQVTMQDQLPAALASGPARLLLYRVSLSNTNGRTAGWSEPAYTLAGSAPAPVTNFAVRASRLGVVLSWTPVPQGNGELVLKRTQISTPAPAPVVKPAGAARPRKQAAQTLLLRSSDEAGPERGMLLDTSAEAETAYLYTAYRQETVQIGGRSLGMRGAETAPLAFTLHDVFPPPVPTDLTVAGFTQPATAPGQPAAYAADLIWQPVDDPGLAGYNVYRQLLAADGTAAGTRVKLNTAPVPLPAFHDATAAAGVRYQWSVTAVDAKGNESTAATVIGDSEQPE